MAIASRAAPPAPAPPSTAASRGGFAAMAATYGLGVFNDQFFKQVACLLAVSEARSELQGYAAALMALPFVLFAAPAGWCADRFSKRSVIVAAKGLEVAAMAAGAAGLWLMSWPLIMLMVFVMGLQSTLFSPALNGAIPEFFPPEQVLRANSRLKMATTAAMLAGIATAGAVLAGGRPLASAAALAVALLGFAAAFAVPGRPAAHPRARFPWSAQAGGDFSERPHSRFARPLGVMKSAGRSLTAEILDCRGDIELWRVMKLDAFIWAVAATQALWINELGLNVLGLDERGTSLLVTAELAGLIVGGGLAGRWGANERWRKLLSAAAGLAGLGGFLAAAAATAAVASPGPAIVAAAAAALILMGFGGGLFLVPLETYIQVRPAPERRGRVLAAGNALVFAAIMAACVALGVARQLGMDAWAGFLTLGAALSAAALYCRRTFADRADPRDARQTPGATASRPEDAPASPRDAARGLRLFLWLARRVLSLRYRVTVRGLDLPRDPPPGARGLLLLPNHPALIDPVLLVAWLWPALRFRPLVDARQAGRPGVRAVARRLGAIAIPDATREGARAAPAIDAALRELSDAIARGQAVLLYPSGRASWSALETLGGNSGAERLARENPAADLAAARIRGLWGSAFSRAGGHEPRILSLLGRGFWLLLANGLFFAPRRKVDIELFRPDGLRGALGDRRAFNRRLEAIYNADPQPNTRVPYGWWETGGARVLPEPVDPAAAPALPAAESAEPPSEAAREIAAALRERAGLPEDPKPGDRLAADLGLDSLAAGEFVVWLENRFGARIASPERLTTVADALLAAEGRGPAMAGGDEAPPPPRAWFARETENDPLDAPGTTLPEALLRQAARNPRAALLADGGALWSYRRLLVAIHALAPEFSRLPGERLGLLLPASAGATAAFYAALWAGKTPVLFNWTVGGAAVAQGAERLGVEAIVTSARLVERLAASGIDLAAARDRLRPLEALMGGLSKWAKLRAFLRAWRLAGPLRDVSEIAAVLFTSGSEATPKAVPLTHANLLTNLRDVFGLVPLRRNDALLAMLPPFHSFGLLTGMALPAVSGMRAVYHPNPLDGPGLASAAERYRATLVLGTPAFAAGMARAARPGALASVRLAVTGAEACPEGVRGLLRDAMPGARLLEGYGITECSPILALDDYADPRPGVVGRPLPSVVWRLSDPDHPERSADGRERPGLLWVRGPSVFGGYLGEAPWPFAEFDRQRWYGTGDLIRVDADGRWIFAGRLKRFAKLGGEMISLPAIEAALERVWPARSAPGQAPRPVAAVIDVPAASAGTGAAEIELLLAAAVDINRAEANRVIREAGLSGLHTIRRVRRVEEIPLLGTGKIDYRRLRAEAAGQQ